MQIECEPHIIDRIGRRITVARHFVLTRKSKFRNWLRSLEGLPKKFRTRELLSKLQHLSIAKESIVTKRVPYGEIAGNPPKLEEEQRSVLERFLFKERLDNADSHAFVFGVLENHHRCSSVLLFGDNRNRSQVISIFAKDTAHRKNALPGFRVPNEIPSKSERAQ